MAMSTPTCFTRAADIPQLQSGGMIINVSIPSGAACCCSVSVTTPQAASGTAGEGTHSTCMTLKVDAMPTSGLSSSQTLWRAGSLRVLPSVPVSSISLRTPLTSPTAGSRLLSSPTAMPRSSVSSLTAMTTPGSTSMLPCGSVYCHISDSSVLGNCATLPTAMTPSSSPSVVSRPLSSPRVEPRLSPASMAASSSSLLSKLSCASTQNSIPTSALQCSLVACTHTPNVKSESVYCPRSNIIPCLGLGSVLQHPENALALSSSVASTSASTATASSAAPTVSTSSPDSSTPNSPAFENLEPLDCRVDASRRRRLCKSWSCSTAASSDEITDDSNDECPIFARKTSRAKTSSVIFSFPGLLDDHKISVAEHEHASMVGAQDLSKRAIQEANEAHRRLTLALELLEVMKPRSRVVREEMQHAIINAATADLSEMSLLDLTKVQDRLKTAVANAKSFFYSGVDIQASSQLDDASRALHAFRDAIDVANSASTLLLETAELFQEGHALQGSELQDDVDVDGLQVEAFPLLHISRLQDIRGLLAKVLTVSCEYQLSLDEVQEAEKHRRKIHSAIQDLKGQVRVYCRLRNLGAEESSGGQRSIIEVINETTLEVPSSGVYEFDQIFAPGTQNEVFEECRDLVQSAIDGRNVTIFTYGQTGSGKTYTMYGACGDEGIAPRAVSEVFKSIDRLRDSYDITITASLMELYQSKIYDMLCGRAHRGTKLQIREDTSGAVWIEGLEEISARNASELLAALRRGVAQRATAAHAMNRESSRSHLIFTIKIASVSRITGEMTNGKLLLCDLAGSERIKKTEVEGERQKEAIDINKSLAALGNVIMAVAAKKRQVPYRDHRLTQLMRDSIGGTAKTLMFVNTSTSPADLSQTVSSLEYATRATRVYNKGASSTAKSSLRTFEN